jgi:tetratricopeptide (TPR) repeat protein
LSSLDDHLVRERDGRVRFRHRLIRDVAYELLPFRRRQELHLRAARTIEATAGDAAAEALVLHFHHAQQYPETWHYGCIAGGRALAKNAPIESMAHYERALVAARRLPELTRSDVAHTWEQLSVAANLGGFYDRAKAALRAARQLRDDDPVSLADLCFREARLADRHSRSQDVIRWVRRGLKALDGRDDDPARKARAALEALYAYTRQQGGKPREAIEWARKVVEGADADTSSVALAQAYLVLDWAHIDLGCADLAVHAPRAIELLEAVGEHAELAVALNNLGAFAYFQGRWHDALDLYRRATATFDKIGDVVDAGLGTSNQAEIFTHQGRLDEAEALLQQTISLWRSMSFPLGLAMANRHLGRVRLRQDRLDEALDLFADAHAVFAGYGLSGKVIEVDAWVAECLLRRGELDRAVELVEDALRREHAGGGTEMAPMLHRLAGYAAAAQGRLVDAWAALDLSLHVARGRGASYDVALALEGMSVVAELGGPTLEEGHDDERRALLDQLGVRVAPAPPLVLSA